MCYKRDTANELHICMHYNNKIERKQRVSFEIRNHYEFFRSTSEKCIFFLYGAQIGFNQLSLLEQCEEDSSVLRFNF